MLNKPLFWVIIIFIAASIFRLSFLDLIEFKLDEARDVYEMERFWSDPYFIQRGTIQSTGIYNPPLWYYFLAIISWPSRDPQYLSFMIALINCVGVAGFYWVIQRFYGQFVGVSAGLLMAFSPWAILFSRKIWAPDMILPLVVSWLYFLHVILLKFTSEESLRVTIGGVAQTITPGVGSDSPGVKSVGWAWFGLVLTLMLLVQLHASGIFLAVGTVVVLSISRMLHPRGVILGLKVHLGGVLLGLLLGLIPLLPYINYQIKTGCEDCNNYSSYRAGEAQVAPTFDSKAFLRPFQFINGSGWDNTLGSLGYRDFLEQYPLARIINFIFLLEFLLLPVGVFYLCSPRRSQSPPSRWILVGLAVLIPIIYFLTKTPAHLYYFLIISPISILIYAIGIIHLGGAKAHLRGVSIAVISIIIIINIIFEISFYKYLTDNPMVPGDYGATFKVAKEMAEERGLNGLERAEFWINLFNSSGS